MTQLPEIYIQSIEDEAEEEKTDLDDAFDSTLGGKNTDGFRVALRDGEGYLSERVYDLEEAYDALETLAEDVEREAIPSEEEFVPEEYLIEERHWLHH